MCSPVEEIMQDAKDNHTGQERDAVTSLFKKWFCNEVSFFIILLPLCEFNYNCQEIEDYSESSHSVFMSNHLGFPYEFSY